MSVSVSMKDNNNNSDYYYVLSVEPNVDAAGIKRAYFKMVSGNTRLNVFLKNLKPYAQRMTL